MMAKLVLYPDPPPAPLGPASALKLPADQTTLKRSACAVAAAAASTRRVFLKEGIVVVAGSVGIVGL